MRQVILAAVLALLGVAACGVSVPVAKPAPFTPEDVEPRCELKPDAPPDARQERDRLMASWAAVRTNEAARRREIAAFADELGLDARDESLVVDTVTSTLEELSSRGCQTKCEPIAQCDTVAIKCASDPAVQPAADKLAAIINRHWPKLRDMKDEHPQIEIGKLVTAAKKDECDFMIPYSIASTLSTMHLRHALSRGAIGSMKNDCPGSTATCKAECDAGNGSSCVFAASDKALGDEEKFELYVKACESKPTSDDKYNSARSGCSQAMTKATLEAHPALRDRAAALIDRLCEATPPSERCAYAVSAAGPQDWFRARPIRARLVEALPNDCEALGAANCTLMVYGLADALRPEARAKIGAIWRKQCDGGDAKACISLGQGALPNVPAADRAKDIVRACELDADQCWFAATCFEQGKCSGIPADAERARHANQRLCDKFKAAVKNDEAAASYGPCKKAAP